LEGAKLQEEEWAMPETIVNLTRAQLNSNLVELMDPADTAALVRAAKNRLGKFKPTAVSVQFRGNGAIVEFTITAPAQLKEDDVRAALA
jgi:hypothetical protein